MFSRKKLFSSSKNRRVSDGSVPDAGSSASSSIWEDRAKSFSSNAADNKSGSVSRSRSASPLPPNPLMRNDTLSAERVPDPLGLSVLYTPSERPVADIIFLHGLGGSSRMTWCKNRRLELFWPQEWLPMDEDVQKARIISFGYNARFRSAAQSSVLGISDFSKNLLFDMLFAKDSFGSDLHLGEAPIIFVAHSMGGLVFKKAYLDAQLDTRYINIMKAVKAVVFLSTPHRGADLAAHLNKVLSISFTSTPKQYVAELNEQGPFLRAMNEQFRHVATGLQIFSFYETLQTQLGSISSVLILDAESAKLGYPGEVSRSLNADHQSICKFENPQDPNFKVILGALKSLVSSFSTHDTQSNPDDMMKIQNLLAVITSIDHDLDLYSSRRAEGTCEWLLEQQPCRSWLSASSKSCLLWLHGRPARGKSVISSFIVRHLQSKEAAVQYFFFRAGDETKRTIASMLKPLAFQVASYFPAFGKSLLALMEGGYKLKDTDWRATWKKIFVGLLFEMDFTRPLYWIIDGIDEANSPQHIMEMMADVADSKVPIKVILSSRWRPNFVTAMERIGKRLSSSVLCIDQDRTDIKIYAMEELKYSNWDEHITQEVIGKVVEGSNDNFLWVHLILEEMKDCNTEEDIRERLAELPPGMDELYKRMEETISSITRPSDKNLAYRLLCWAIHARRTLSPDELVDALEPEFGRFLDISHTLSRLCGHFVIVEGNKRVGLIHQTAREYLASSTTLPFSLNTAKNHSELFTQSLSSFLDKTLRSKLQRVSSKIFEYRSTAWPRHLSAAKSSGDDDEHLDLLMKFFSQPPVLTWVNILASLGQLKVLIETSEFLYDFVKRKRKAESALDPRSRRYDDLEYLETWSRDLLKVIAKFGSCLAQHPDSIYTCIAPFCPVTSSIHKTFGLQQSSSVQVIGLSQDWDDCLVRISVGSESMAASICCSARHLAVSNYDGTIFIWDCTTFHEINRLVHGDDVSAICFSATGDTFASYGFSATKLWNPETGELLRSIINQQDTHALCMQFTADDGCLIIGSDRRCLLRANVSSDAQLSTAWEIIHGGVLHDTESNGGTYMNSPTSLAISPDGSKVAVAYRRFPLTVWVIDPVTMLTRLSRSRKHDQLSKPLPFVSKFSWHPSGDELIGLFMDGFSFKISFIDGSYEEQPPSPGQVPADIICSANGLVYAICGVGGTVKLYDYQSSTLIYQLTSDEMITAFCFSQDGRRFYDIRESFCTVWEPNALIRLSVTDDDVTHSQSPDESVQQSNVASEASVDYTAPIFIMCPMHRGTSVCFGDEDGAVELFNFSTSAKVRVEQMATGLSIEHLSWSPDDEKFCYAELGGRLTIVQLDETSQGTKTRRLDRFEPGTNSSSVTQLLFPWDSSALLLASPESAQVWSLEPAKMEFTYKSTSPHSHRKWISHPDIPNHIISLTPYDVILHKRQGLQEVSSWLWEDSVDNIITEPSASSSSSVPGGSPILKSSFTEVVESVFLTFFHSFIILKISRQKSSQKLRPRFLILDCASVQVSGQSVAGTLTPVHIPDIISSKIEMPLNILGNGSLVFIDSSFWVCSWQLKSSTEHVKRHYFLPRDWLPVQSLGLLHITDTGKTLCPRKGGISVINSTIGSMW